MGMIWFFTRPRRLTLFGDTGIPTMLVLPVIHEDLLIALIEGATHLTRSLCRIGILLPSTHVALLTSLDEDGLAQDRDHAVSVTRR